MGTYQVEAWISVSHPTGTPIAPENLARSLDVEARTDQMPYTVNGLNTLWASANLYICQIHQDDFNSQSEPSEAFFAAAEAEFQTCARWLAGLSMESLEKFYARGFRARFWVYAWVEQNQFELVLPSELMAELGRLRLPLQLMTEGR